MSDTFSAASPLKSARGSPANHAARNWKMSATLDTPLWSKSHLQQGVVLFPDELQALPRPEKCCVGAPQTARVVIVQAEPSQHAPVGCGHGFGVHGVLFP